MATNKNAFIRYKILDKCFRNTGRRYFIEDLIEECNMVLLEMYPDSNGISLRTIRDDIAFMKSSEGWEIELANLKAGKKSYYRYLNPSFSINNMPLNDLEVNQLRSAVNILSQFKGMPQFEWIHELVPKLKQGITSEEKMGTIIEFDNNAYLKGIENLGQLHDAIYYKKVLAINYQPYENEVPFEIILHPYYLKQYNNRWFLFGYNPQNEKPDWNLAIDRIISLKEIKGKYLNNSLIDWEEYFNDIIGVTKPTDAEIENVVLHFNAKTGKYMETKPIHETQISKWLDKNTFEARLKVIINYELERLILSYADSVKVIKPIRLATIIKKRLKEAIEQY